MLTWLASGILATDYSLFNVRKQSLPRSGNPTPATI